MPGCFFGSRAFASAFFGAPFAFCFCAAALGPFGFCSPWAFGFCSPWAFGFAPRGLLVLLPVGFFGSLLPVGFFGWRSPWAFLVPCSPWAFCFLLLWAFCFLLPVGFLFFCLLICFCAPLLFPWACPRLKNLAVAFWVSSFMPALLVGRPAPLGALCLSAFLLLYLPK